jgi:hypothetical protein
MSKRFSSLSKTEQRKVEAAYHQMQPADFDEFMAQAEQHTPETIRLPATLVEELKAMAELAGEQQYQTMVKRWIEERLQQEAKLALRVARQPKPRALATLARKMTKKTVAQA